MAGIARALEPVGKYRHNGTGRSIANAHIKRQVMGGEVVAALADGCSRKPVPVNIIKE